MENYDKAQQKKEIEIGNIQSLRSGNSKVILETISKLRKRGSITILSEIFELMLITEDSEVKDACTNLLNDLKKVEIIPIMIEALSDKNYLAIRKYLVASCWQSGLDYHDHTEIFIDIAIDGDYANALEAFTVIEECIGQVEDNTRAAYVLKINKALENASQEKQPLLKELADMIDRF